jgi:hypothetical protein
LSLPYPPVPDVLREPLSRLSLMALPPSLHYRVRHWDELDDAEREVTKADCERMAGLAIADPRS